ncbi:OmpA family protein [Sansalvadorimonas sp. 2012CJ34-2]|uniref:Peptidoglycan-associated lipoprotein n=1 Tax=Parendozoicomonas callyspongiae TaxID=2942213 RepID=A0ABT0PFT8_9GAMM|nr:OmpA family protein [Sansalvadorimonas sp. 2012CJ34-2]MCL6270245.1 OmpA family protein [Sansalvadorimonas sp. 2012CJ34-2]
MKFATLAKGIATGLAVVWLAGCATSTQTAGGGEEATTKVGQGETVVEASGITDPAVQAVIASGKIDSSKSPEQIAALLEQNVYHFGFDSDKLKPGALESLDVHAAYLTSPAGRAENLVIEGNTDERGTRTYNLALGERRAKAVKNYLVLKGVAPARIELVSYGLEKPVDPAHTEAAWAKNRRAVIVPAGK